MTRNEHNSFTLTAVIKELFTALHSVFFSDSNRDFQRLKNFIAS